MNHTNHPKTQAKDDHGSIASYVVGFVLSLIFTIIPYYLVVNKVLVGNTLLFTILAIAVWQMIIQLVFFLHLGRGPKPFYNIVFFFATAGVIIITIGASLFIMDNLYRTMSPKELVLRQAQEENIAQISGNETGACVELRTSRVLVLNSEMILPALVEAGKCDKLTFLNETGQDVKIAFGTHPEDTSYGGIDEVLVKAGESETITLNETGEFRFHDHNNSLLEGRIVVTP